MEKMLIIIYNVALERVILEYIEDCGITCFTMVPKVFGKGKTGGPHMGTHVWPGENAMLWVVDDEERIKMMLERVKQLKEKHKGKGVKAFVMLIEEKL